jgi:Na+-transporting NADH:ubiquinone oxidoreductase subunit NqrB
MTWQDLVGFIGVAFVVVTYFLSQVGRMETAAPLYPALNALGAALILFSLAFTFNAASVVIETFWLVISLIGLVRSLTKKRTD